jgi:hypothetical protein
MDTPNIKQSAIQDIHFYTVECSRLIDSVFAAICPGNHRDFTPEEIFFLQTNPIAAMEFLGWFEEPSSEHFWTAKNTRFMRELQGSEHENTLADYQSIFFYQDS